MLTRYRKLFNRYCARISVSKTVAFAVAALYEYTLSDIEAGEINYFDVFQILSEGSPLTDTNVGTLLQSWYGDLGSAVQPFDVTLYEMIDGDGDVVAQPDQIATFRENCKASTFDADTGGDADTASISELLAWADANVTFPT